MKNKEAAHSKLSWWLFGCLKCIVERHNKRMGDRLVEGVQNSCHPVILSMSNSYHKVPQFDSTSKTFLSVFVCSTWFRFITFSFLHSSTKNRPWMDLSARNVMTDCDTQSESRLSGLSDGPMLGPYVPGCICDPSGASSLHRLDPLPRSCAAQASPEAMSISEWDNGERDVGQPKKCRLIIRLI